MKTTSQKNYFSLVTITLTIPIFFVIFLACKNEKSNSLEAALYPIDSTITSINKLPKLIKESSGLVSFDSSIWTQNDSGDEPIIYQLDIDNQSLTQESLLLGAQNIDWEELAQDSQFLYVGDFGNNVGNRQDLVIYKVPKNELSKDTISNFEKIKFQYPDQLNFNNTAYRHNFDCEAMIVFEDSIYLFSKNHQDYQTRLYRLPKTAGNHTPELMDSFDVNGTITAAAMDKTKSVLVLSGYKYNGSDDSFNPFLWVFWNYADTQFFGGNSQRIIFPFDKQIEGICHVENGNFIISSEGESGDLGELYLFDVKKWTN